MLPKSVKILNIFRSLVIILEKGRQVVLPFHISIPEVVHEIFKLTLDER